MKSRIELYKDVIEQLAFDPSVDEREIAVAVSEGVITLTGTVESYAQKIAAEKAVRRVSGVRGIAEELKIEPPALHVRNDVDLANSALGALRWNANLSKDEIEVTLRDGHVTLSGTVDWQYQREAAHAAVAALSGIRGVSNQIALRHRIVASDVAARIRQSFRRIAESEADDIEIEATGQTVTLRGKLHSWSERDDAVTAAYSIPGVARVKNLTTIS